MLENVEDATTRTMVGSLQVREDLIASLAIRLRRNLLSADEFQRELTALTRSERAALVEYLDRLEKGIVQERFQARAGKCA